MFYDVAISYIISCVMSCAMPQAPESMYELEGW
jgi:hypothetical protein